MPPSRRDRRTTTTVTCPVCQATHDAGDRDGVGGLVVYVTSTCPICLEERTPLVALGCGHAFCREDFERVVRDKRRRARRPSTDDLDPFAGFMIGLADDDDDDDYDEDHDDDDDDDDEGESESEIESDDGDVPSLTTRSDNGTVSEEEEDDDDDDDISSGGGSSSGSSSDDGDTGLSNAIARMVRAEVTRQLQLLEVDARVMRRLEEGGGERAAEMEAAESESESAAAAAGDRPPPSRGDLSPSEGREGQALQGDEDGEVVALWVLGDDTGGGLWRVTPSDRELVPLRLPGGLGRLVGTDGRGGAWLHVPVEEGRRDGDYWELVHVSHLGRVRRRGHRFPLGSEMAVDGRGGVWAMVEDELWRADPSGERLVCEDVHPRSKLVGDGHGGVWTLRPLEGDHVRGRRQWDDVWEVWHVNRRREERMVHHYPRGTAVAGGGVAGCRSFWALTPTGELWYADLDHEYLMYSYPPGSRIAEDGRGGVWVHRRTCRGWKLWHADRTRERSMYRCRRDSKVVGDGRGGAWILQQDGGRPDGGGGGGGTWSLWHATMDSYRKVHEDYPRDAQLASAF